MIETVDPKRGERVYAFTQREIEDMLWDECRRKGARARPEHVTYGGGVPAHVYVIVPIAEGVPLPIDPRVAEVLRGCEAVKAVDLPRLTEWLGRLQPDEYRTASSIQTTLGSSIMVAALIMRDLLSNGAFRCLPLECPECSAHVEMTLDDLRHLDYCLECPECAHQINLAENVLCEIVRA